MYSCVISKVLFFVVVANISHSKSLSFHNVELTYLSTYTYHVVKLGDTCYDIGKPWGMTPQQLEIINRNTRGWIGCDNIRPGDTIRITQGLKPLPVPDPTHNCSPKKTGTKQSLFNIPFD